PFNIIRGTISDRDYGGTIKYKIPGDSTYSKILSNALSNFHYNSIHGYITGQGDIINLDMLIKGSNPNFQSGRTIELKMKIEENIYNLYRSLTYGP
ncbi:MAG: hypothetical protein HOI53_04395, partial [Francisellaceae bacterium]|nr:hypothetical protein [Francisellaceae bacterium]